MLRARAPPPPRRREDGRHRRSTRGQLTSCLRCKLEAQFSFPLITHPQAASADVTFLFVYNVLAIRVQSFSIFWCFNSPGAMYGDMLVWGGTPTPAPRQMRRSRTAGSLYEDDYDLHEVQALAALKAQQRRRLQRPVQKTEVQRLLRETGKLQEKAQHVERRVRRDFRETNMVSDIHGASSRNLMGRTASGVSVDRTQPWPYARDFATDTQGLFDVPPLPRGLGAEGSFETAAIETHLGLPGVNLHVRRRELEPMIVPAPRAPVGSVYDAMEQYQGAPIPLDARSRARPPPRRLIQEDKRPPQWPKPALDTPQAPAVVDRSLSTTDIMGARPRRLVSVHERVRHMKPPETFGASLFY